MGPMGRLYAVDMRLRPTGKSGSLVLPLAEFRRYFDGARLPVVGTAVARAGSGRARRSRFPRKLSWPRSARRCSGRPWSARLVDELRAMRHKLEATAGPRSLKRGPGGIVDVEFAVQLLQLKYGRTHPRILCPNVWDALEALEERPACCLPPRPRPCARLLVPSARRGAAANRHGPAAHGGAGSGRGLRETRPPAGLRLAGSVPVTN